MDAKLCSPEPISHPRLSLQALRVELREISDLRQRLGMNGAVLGTSGVTNFALVSRRAFVVARHGPRAPGIFREERPFTPRVRCIAQENVSNGVASLSAVLAAADLSQRSN